MSPGSGGVSRRTFLAAGATVAGATLPVLPHAIGRAAAQVARPSAPALRPSAAYDANVGTTRQLFADDYRIESMVDVNRTVHAGRKIVGPHTGTRTIVPYGENPWEPTRNQLYGSVIYDDDERVFKMWYRTLLPTGEPRICYAVSPDGLRWTKPDLGIGTFGGSTRNNIVLYMDMASVIKDKRDPDPERRYKLFGWRTGGYTVAFSPDGLRWHGQQVVLPDSDTCSANYDPISDQFIATTKHPNARGRAVYLSTSKDFVNWSTPSLIMTGDDRGDFLAKASPLVTNVEQANEQIYACPIIPSEGMYVALPWSFEYTGGNGPGGNVDGMVRPQIAFSRDLANWDRVDRTFLIDSGPGGSFDSGIIQGTTNDIIVKDGKIWLYYSGFNTTHGGPLDIKRVSIGLVQWRIDGFVSASNGGDVPGVVVTKPVTVNGRHLQVNADLTSQVGRSGELRVEVLDPSGRAIPGLRLSDAITTRGDHTDVTVQWRGAGDLSRLHGKQVKLRFVVAGGDLYSYHFSN